MLRRSKRSLLAAFGVMFATACGSTTPAQLSSSTRKDTNRPWAYVRIPSRLITPNFVKTSGWQRDHKRDDVYAFGYVKRSSLEHFSLAEEREIIELDPKVLNHYEFDAKTLALKEWPRSPDTELAPAYHDYSALTAEVKDIAAAFPELVTLESIGRSVESRDIWSLELSGKGQDDPGLPKLLYIANMHGDEVVGRELMLYLSRYLAENYAKDGRIQSLLDHARIRIIPSMNPDGFEKEQRYNAEDVDLNRDFPDFTSDNRDTPDGRAIETKAIMALHYKHIFVLSANFHGGEVCFNMPWDTKDNFRQSDRFGDDALMVRMARKYADSNRTMRANSGGSFERGVTYGYEWYEVDGGMQDWSIHYRASTHGTVELSYAKWPPANQLPRLWDENREAMISYLENGVYGFHFRIIDSAGEPVTKATVKIASLGRDLTYEDHLVHRTALPGSQMVRITAPGYAPYEKTMEPSIFGGAYQTIVLQR